jgi:hypothetical protein
LRSERLSLEAFDENDEGMKITPETIDMQGGLVGIYVAQKKGPKLLVDIP